MVEFSELSRAAQQQVRNRLRGRPLGAGGAPNKLIKSGDDFIRANPEFTAAVEGRGPAGLSKSQRRAFAQRGQELSKIPRRERESLQSLASLSRRGGESISQTISSQTTSPEPPSQTFRASSMLQGGQDTPQSFLNGVQTDSRRIESPSIIESLRAPREVVREARGQATTFTQDILFGERGEKLLSIGLFAGPPGSSLSFKQIKGGLKSGGLGIGGQVIEPIIPATVGGLLLGSAAIGGSVKLLAAAPPIARIGLGAITTPFEVTRAIDPKQPAPERIRSGIFATLGGAGAVFEGAPFIKGVTTRFSPSFRGVTSGEFVEPTKLFPSGRADVIKSVPVSGGDPFDVRLIPPGKGFGFTPGEQEAFIGKRGTITTSARDLFGGGKDVKIQEGEAGLGLFFTPTIGDVAEARVSRLALSDLFKPSGFDAKIGFSSQRPQIVFARDVPITRTGKPGTARGVGFPSSELEVTLQPGSILTGERVGTTTLSGQKVEIFEAFLGSGRSPTAPPSIDIPGFKIPKIKSRGVDPLVSPASLGITAKGFFGLPSSRPTRGSTFPSSISPSTDFGFSRQPPRGRGDSFLLETPRFFPESVSPSTPPLTRGTRGVTSETFLPSLFSLGDIGEQPFKRLKRTRKGKEKDKQKKGRARKPRAIRPSLTGITLADFGDIFGQLPKGGGRLGVLPSQIRFRQRPKRGKR